jgi:hypothetical protein
MNIRLNIIIPSARTSSKWSLSFIFPHQIPICTYAHHSVTCPVHLIRLLFCIIILIYDPFSSSCSTVQLGPGPPHSLKVLYLTQWHTTIGRTSLDEGSAPRRDIYLTTHDTHKTYPCLRWGSNQQSQQAIGYRLSPWTARPLGPACNVCWQYSLSPTCVLLDWREFDSAGANLKIVERYACRSN